jgi:outer membrane murein-binding lipoprotein Lpp
MKTTTHKVMAGVIVLQGLLLATTWSGQSAAVARGDVNLPDPGARQLQMIDELKTLNAKVDRLTAALVNGEVTVKVAKDKDAK